MRLRLFYKFLYIIFSFVLLTQCTLPEIDDIDPPIVDLLYPYDGGVVSGDIIISIQATDDRLVKEVWYYLDGHFMEKKSGSGNTFELDVTPYADEKQHVFQALANDEAGNQGSSERAFVIISKTGDITPPTVQIINPVSGQQVTDTIRVIAHAFDNYSVREVAFFVDGDSLFSDDKYPYEYLLQAGTMLGLGEHSVFARAFDTSGNFTSSDAITINVVSSLDQIPPTIVLLYPLAGSTLNGTVDIASDIRDNVAVSRVEYFVDGGTSGSPDYISSSAPWYYEWNTAAWADSASHTLYIKAYDTAGNIGTLGPISYTIE